MKKLKVLDLFSGTQSIAKAFRKNGHETFTIEWDKSHEGIDWYEDIMNVTAQDILDRFGQPDVIWASPDCTTYSIAGISHHRTKEESGNLKAKSDYAKTCDTVNKHVLELIKELNPKYYFIENPRGGLRKMDFMQDLPRYTVTYCQYGDTRMKPTDLFTNHPNPKFKPMCKNGDPCHVAAPRGSRTGTQGLQNAKLRSVIPEDLCKHIVKISEENIYDRVVDEFIRSVQEDSTGFQYIIYKEEVEEKFNLKLDDKDIGNITYHALGREEIADIIYDDDGFDVVLYTSYANLDEDHENYDNSLN